VRSQALPLHILLVIHLNMLSLILWWSLVPNDFGQQMIPIGRFRLLNGQRYSVVWSRENRSARWEGSMASRMKRSGVCFVLLLDAKREFFEQICHLASTGLVSPHLERSHYSA
jgi:hypothetical protein